MSWQVISDLLKPDRQNLVIREDRKRGVYVDGLSEWVVRSPAEVTLTACSRPATVGWALCSMTVGGALFQGVETCWNMDALMSKGCIGCPTGGCSSLQVWV